MDNKQIPVNRLGREEFAAALRKGQGRALLHIHHYGLDGVADIVLEACLHNQVYDQLIDSGRGDWLFSMFQGTSYFPDFRTAILNALNTETDKNNLFQLCELAMNIAALDDEEVRQALREVVYRYASDPSENYSIGAGDWIELAGADGLLELARIYGRRLIVDPDDDVYDGNILNLIIFDYFEEYPSLVKVLKENAENDAAVHAYLEYLEALERQMASGKPVDKETIKKKTHRKIRKQYKLEDILVDARKAEESSNYRYRAFGMHATPKELDRVYAEMISETDETIQARLLWVFRRSKLPKLDEILFRWASGTNDDLRFGAIAALGQIADEQIHRLAKEKVETRSLVGTDKEALGLFLHNYDTGDAALIAEGLHALQPGPDDAHSLGYSIRELADRYDDPGLVDVMLWVYEETPCGLCRYTSIKWLDHHNQITDKMRFECQYDAEEDIQAFVRAP